MSMPEPSTTSENRKLGWVTTITLLLGLVLLVMVLANRAGSRA